MDTELNEEDMVLRREKKKSKKDNDIFNVEPTGIKVGDNGVDSWKDDKQKKKNKMREKKEQGIYLLDVNVIEEEVARENDHTGARSEKKRKLECKKDDKEQEDDVELFGLKENKNRKKKNRNKVEKGMGSQNGVREAVEDKETSSKKCHVQREIKNESLSLSKDETELDKEADLEPTKDKKKKKEKKYKSKGVSSSLEEIFDDEEAGKSIETSVNPEVREGHVIREKKMEKKKKKHKKGSDIETEVAEEHTTNKKKNEKDKGSDVESLTIKSFDEVFTKDKKSKDIASNGERNKNDHVEGGSDIDLRYSKKRKKDKKCKTEIEDCKGSDVEAFTIKSFDEISTKDKKSKNVAIKGERNKKDHVEGGYNIDLRYSKKRKKDKKCKNEIEDGSKEILEKPIDIEKTLPHDNDANFNEGYSVSKKKRDKEKVPLQVETEKFDKSTRKKAKFIKDVEERNINERETRTEKEESADHSEDSRPKKPSKRVKFSSKVEVFPLSRVKDVRKENKEGGMVRGKRFSQDEDLMLKNAVLNYIQEHDLGDDGLEMVLHNGSFPELKNCWSEINAALPWRPHISIYNRAHILFERDEKRKWTLEEKECIKKFYEANGPNKWAELAAKLGKNRYHVRDAWRRIKLPNKKRGHWSQDEYQKLFDLVNVDMRVKVFQEKKSMHGMLRDNICWEAISDKLSTRTNAACCLKWYNQLASPLVRDGKWASSDDYRLLQALLTRDFSSVEEVDWDNLLDHRSGDVCRKRWYQMFNHLGNYGNKDFPDQVETLSKRYCPDLVEPVQEYEDKIPVP